VAGKVEELWRKGFVERMSFESDRPNETYSEVHKQATLIVDRQKFDIKPVMSLTLSLFH